MIYLDHAASSPLVPEALKMLSEANECFFANPSAKHSLGHNLANKIEEVRKIILEHFGADLKFDLIFTSGATESNNIFIQSCTDCSTAYFFSGDHPSLYLPVIHTFKEHHKISLKNILSEGPSDNQKSLHAVSLVNGQSGECLNLDELKKLKSQFPQAVVFLDCSQAFTKVFELQGFLRRHFQLIDGLSLSAHKMGGPKGIGALIFKKNFKLQSIYLGGGQEKGIRPGTLSAPLILSWGEAIKKREKDLLNVGAMKVRYLKLIEMLKLSFGDKIIFPFENKLNSFFILSFILPSIPADILIRHLEEKGIYLSTSSACSSKIEGKNPVFAAMGIDDLYHKNILRVSLSYETTLAELQIFTEELRTVYFNLLELFGKK